MTKYVIANGRIYTENETIEQGYILIENGKIIQLLKVKYQGDLTTIDVKTACLPSLLISYAWWLWRRHMDASFEGLKHLSESLLSKVQQVLLPLQQ